MKKSQETTEFWEKHLETYRKSRMSQMAYCRKHGLKIRAFTYRLARMQKQKSAPPAIKKLERVNGWLPLAVTGESSGISYGGVKILIGKITVKAERGFDAPHLADVLRAVGAAC
jgi:hypothetical protein